ncbi:MAG: hypothetical protein HZB53_03145 [Chloroflexi bacterium]|nr:hypothetical protein [Chloroflexota bacterium]
MDGQEFVVWELTKDKAACFQRDAAQSQLATSFGCSEPIVNRLRFVVPMALGLAAALAVLMVR